MRALLALITLLALSSSWAAQPRIVSINPCVDAVLMRVADPEQIAGISYYSRDARATSIPLDLADRFHATSGTAEEVIALAPDHVITGPHVSPSTILALERLNIHLLKQKVPESVAESERQIREIAAITGHPQRGEQLITEIEQALDAARPRDSRTIGAVIWQGGGLVPGDGTLASELLRRTGYRNLSQDYGLRKWDVLPLEYLIAAPPDVLLSVGTGEDGRDRMLGHPVVEKLTGRIELRRYPFRLLQCAGPTIIAAVSRLAEIRNDPAVMRRAR